MEEVEPLNILVVDDEEEICRIFAKWLSSGEHRVESALSGKEAIDLVKKKYFDIVFLDIVMPGISGIDTLEEIKKISPKTKAIMITGRLLDKRLLNKLRQRGASGFLQKPFKIEDIKEIIR